MTAATIIVTVCEIWIAIGLMVGVWFVIFEVGRIDPAARGAYTFRPLLLPGVALLWPVVLWRWRTLARGASGGGH